MATHAKVALRKLCPCGERKINMGSDRCNECHASALRVCMQCGVAVGRSGTYCDDCWKVQRVASRHSRQLRLEGFYRTPCPECGKTMHCVEDFRICQWCSYNVLLVDGVWK